MFGLGGIIDLLKSLVDLFPNAQQRADAAAKIQDIEAQIATAQSATNTAEAATGNLFLAGWRPAIGWICAGGFAYIIFGEPLLGFKPIDENTVNAVLWAMLGIGGYRTIDKLGGVATDAISGLFKRRR